MPIRRYIASKPGRCPLCKEGFDHVHQGDDLIECPRCGAQVQSVQSGVNSPRILRPIGTVEAKDAGFVVMERNKHGLYEKQ